LRCWDFGDYYNDKAIPWAYEYITEVLQLDPDRLWYTVHETDDKARQVWVDTVGVSPGTGTGPRQGELLADGYGRSCWAIIGDFRFLKLTP
jgi:tRNA synthetases class II (A)